MPAGPHRILRSVAVLVAVALLATAGCTVGPSQRPPVAVRGTDLPAPDTPVPTPSAVPLPPLGDYRSGSLMWQDCTDAISGQLGAPAPTPVDCADMRVDADVSLPGLGDFLQLDLTRLGRGPAPLVVLGEASGEPGTVRAARLAAELPPAVLDSFTLIGLARRGTGPSEPVNCVAPTTRARIVAADPYPRQSWQLDSLLEVTRTAIQTCVQDLGEMLTAINSTGAADDLEALRVRLGAPVLHVIAQGKASRVVTDFMRRYPTSVGRVVLDGAADPTLEGIPATQAALLAAESGFTAFAADCVDRDCPLAPDPRAALPALAASLQRAPLQVGGLQITGGTAYHAVLETIGTPERWPELAEALAAARIGDGTGIAELVAPTIVPTQGLPARFDPALATHCNDTATRVPPERAGQLVEQWRTRSPLFGPLFAQQLLLCSAWPVPSKTSTSPGLRALPPVLVVATAVDPVTPPEGTRRTAESLPSAILVTWQGQAHGALSRSTCAVELATRFLVEGMTPPQGTLCPP